MCDYLELGPTPYDENCAQVGEDNYREKAIDESRRYIDQLRRQFGPEPEGARLGVKWFAHDYGSYCEVVCHYDDSLPESVEYAYRVESDLPANWA